MSHLFIAGESGTDTLENGLAVSLKVNMQVLHNEAIELLAIIPEKRKLTFKTRNHSDVLQHVNS